MNFLIFFISITVLVVAFIKPKWGTFIVWFLLFTYPHGYWFWHNFLPFNIGFDDLFCITLFLMVLLRRNILGGIPIRFGYAFWVISSFVIVAFVANLSGMSGADSLTKSDIIKSIFKLGIYWGLFYAILHCIDDKRDLKIQFIMFSLAAVAGASIIIMQRYFPYQMEIFQRPRIQGAKLVFYEQRLSGAFMNPNMAACVMACSSMLVVAAVRLQKNKIIKAITYILIFFLLGAALLTKSRAGSVSLLGTFFIMGVFSKSRKAVLFVLIAGFLVSMQMPVIREGFLERIKSAYNPETGNVDQNVVGRIHTWKSYLSSAGPKEYLFGQGFSRGVERNGMESHSVYIALLTVYGFGGVIWATMALVFFFKKVLRLIKYSPDPLFSTVAAGCMWALVAWGIYGLAADVLDSAYGKYLLFYFVVLLDRSYTIASKQEELPLDYFEYESLDITPVYSEAF